jgi:hypothetical protein
MWTDDDALAYWAPADEMKTSLRSTAYRALSASGRLPSEEAGWFAGQLLEEVAHRHRLAFPHFSFTPEFDRERRPLSLSWAPEEVESIGENQLPDWMVEARSADAPPEVEIDWFTRNPELVELIDQTLCAAAAEDKRRRAAAADDDVELSPQVVEEFIDEVARQSGHHPARVVELCAGVLTRRQQNATGRDDAVARTEALASLRALLNEPERFAHSQN